MKRQEIYGWLESARRLCRPGQPNPPLSRPAQALLAERLVIALLEILRVSSPMARSASAREALNVTGTGEAPQLPDVQPCNCDYADCSYWYGTAEAAALRRVVEAAQWVRASGVFYAHYQHFDPQGTAGANCPACTTAIEARKRLCDALDMLEKITLDTGKD